MPVTNAASRSLTFPPWLPGILLFAGLAIAGSEASAQLLPGDTLRYTTDGSTPSRSSPFVLTETKIPVNHTMTLRGQLYRAGFLPSLMFTKFIIFHATGTAEGRKDTVHVASGYNAIANDLTITPSAPIHDTVLVHDVLHDTIVVRDTVFQSAQLAALQSTINQAITNIGSTLFRIESSVNLTWGAPVQQNVMTDAQVAGLPRFTLIESIAKVTGGWRVIYRIPTSGPGAAHNALRQSILK